MAGSPARRAWVRRVLVIITLATIPLYCLGFVVLQRAQAQLKLNFSTPASSSTRVETLPAFVTATDIPGGPGALPAFVTATDIPGGPGALPVQAITPTLAPAAEDFVRQYFQLIDQRAFSQTWAMLSDHYRQQHNPTGYQPYVDFWNTVQTVDVLTVQPIAQDQQTARLSVKLAFHFTNGTNSTQTITVSLVSEAGTGSWLIDDTY
jgi:hypothetical protein